MDVLWIPRSCLDLSRLNRHEPARGICLLVNGQRLNRGAGNTHHSYFGFAPHRLWSEKGLIVQSLITIRAAMNRVFSKVEKREKRPRFLFETAWLSDRLRGETWGGLCPDIMVGDQGARTTSFTLVLFLRSSTSWAHGRCSHCLNLSQRFKSIFVKQSECCRCVGTHLIAFGKKVS